MLMLFDCNEFKFITFSKLYNAVEYMKRKKSLYYMVYPKKQFITSKNGRGVILK